MLRIDRSLATPEENLALDEALYLRHAELADAGTAVEFLRFWESDRVFVVMGAGGKVAQEVDLDACRGAGVPVLRRPSGGGTVVQGPGCLNYALVLSLGERPELGNFTRAWSAILDRTSRALGDDVAHAGISDLARGPMKFSGNAQKRKRTTILHHGTILYDFDLELIPALLPEPTARPEYRDDRSHGEFVENLPMAADEIRERIAGVWSADERFDGTLPDIGALVREKYLNDAWTFRF